LNRVSATSNTFLAAAIHFFSSVMQAHHAIQNRLRIYEKLRIPERIFIGIVPESVGLLVITQNPKKNQR
jgi:hypothetical protein